MKDSGEFFRLRMTHQAIGAPNAISNSDTRRGIILTWATAADERKEGVGFCGGGKKS